MTKTKFVLLLNEVLNEFDCKLLRISYNEENIAIVDYTPNGVSELRIYIPYRFMNRARLRLLIMEELDLLVSVDPELDLGF